jgi:hypothetical protein
MVGSPPASRFFVEKRPEEGQKQELRAVKKPPKMVRAASPSGG